MMRLRRLLSIEPVVKALGQLVHMIMCRSWHEAPDRQGCCTDDQGLAAPRSIISFEAFEHELVDPHGSVQGSFDV